MATRQRIHGDNDRFSEEMDIISADLSKSLKDGLEKGRAPVVATNIAFNAAHVEARMSQAMLAGITSAALIKSSEEGFKRWWRDYKWEDGLNFDDRIAKATLDMKTAIAKELREQIVRSKGWRQVAKGLTDKGLVEGELPKVINKLLTISRRSLAGDLTAKQEYAKALRAAQRHVNRLAKSGAPTSRLKKAYQQVINKTLVGSEAAINAAVDRAVEAKSRYIAERLARTEIAKSYEDVMQRRFAEDEDVMAWRWELSSRHVVTDICDFHAGADMYGIGAGVYPVGEGPVYPAHPHCQCVQTPVYRPKGNPENAKPRAIRGQQWLEEHPRLRKSIMTRKGEKNFQNNPKGWNRNMPNYAGYVDKVPRIPGRYYKDG